jgi:5'-nucleotidase
MPRNVPRSTLRPRAALARRSPLTFVRAALLAAAASTTLLASAPAARAQQGDRPTSTDDEVVARLQNAAATSWRAPLSASDPVEIRLVGINDLHGYLAPGAKAQSPNGDRPMGGAAVLAAYIEQERLTRQKRTLTLIAGDSIGATPPVSGFLRDEPTMAFLNLLADGDCPALNRKTWPVTPAPVVTKCRVISTLGNHEFDKGVAELERLLYGGKHPDGPVLGAEWKGMKIPYVVANVVRREGRAPFLPASALVDVEGVKVGVIGAVTLETASLVSPLRIADVQFLPEARPINAEVEKLKAAGAGPIVLVIHEGFQTPTTPQPYPLQLGEVSGRLKDVIAELDPRIDVVVAGHSHKLTNALIATKGAAPLLVTQARQYGVGFSTIDLTVDRATGQVVAKGARILTPWADAGPGLHPNTRVEKLVAAASKVSAKAESRLVGTTTVKLTRTKNASNESVLGNLVADAQRAAAGTEIAFMNTAGIRNDIDAGPITYGKLYAAQPFGNLILRMTMTGDEILTVLEQQWSGPNAGTTRVLHASGLRYTYDLSRPVGKRVVDTQDAEGLPIDPKRRYSVAASDFIQLGGDNYSGFAVARDVAPVMTDREALERYIVARGGTVSPELDGRTQRLDAPR